MSWIVSVIIIFILTAQYIPQAHAVIFLPAIILIPIAKIIALIIGGFSIPALGLGVVWSKLFKKSLKRTLLVIAVILLLAALLLLVLFKIHDPDRPLF